MTAKKTPRRLTRQKAEYIRQIAELFRRHIELTEESYEPRKRG